VGRVVRLTVDGVETKRDEEREGVRDGE
jgi:hypothetical protein